MRVYMNKESTGITNSFKREKEESDIYLDHDYENCGDI